jgi:hypothetical protein
LFSFTIVSLEEKRFYSPRFYPALANTTFILTHARPRLG